MKNVLNRDLKKFGLTFGIFFPLIFGFVAPLIFNHPFRIWTMIVGLPFIFLGLFSPSTLKTSYKIWILLGNFLGSVNSKIILTIVYITVLIPISMIMKIFNYDPLGLKEKKVNSYKKKVLSEINLNRIF